MLALAAMETPPPSPNPEPTPQPSTPEPPATPPPAPQPPAAGGITEQQWLVFLHLSAFGGIVIPSLGHIIGPLVIWLVKKAESPAIDAAGRDVLNYQISWTIWMFAAIVIAAVGSCIIVPIVVPFALAIAWLIFVIKGALAASRGETFKYPLTIKLL